MTEIKVEIPEYLGEEIEESGIDVSNLVREVLISKAFEIQLSKSRALQRAIFESLVAKSKLSEEGARELANRINSGMLEEIKNKFPEL
ncbi:MAG: hypothetical protein AABX29_06760 [Nanoarchaeota archaeon]